MGTAGFAMIAGTDCATPATAVDAPAAVNSVGAAAPAISEKVIPAFRERITPTAAAAAPTSAITPETLVFLPTRPSTPAIPAIAAPTRVRMAPTALEVIS